jgi:hypothetical protein
MKFILDMILKIESGLLVNQKSDSVLIVFNTKICLKAKIQIEYTPEELLAMITKANYISIVMAQAGQRTQNTQRRGS